MDTGISGDGPGGNECVTIDLEPDEAERLSAILLSHAATCRRERECRPILAAREAAKRPLARVLTLTRP